MDIEMQNKKMELIQWLATLDDESIIEKMMEQMERERRDWWEEISKEERASIAKGIQEANTGNLKSHSEAEINI